MILLFINILYVAITVFDFPVVKKNGKPENVTQSGQTGNLTRAVELAEKPVAPAPAPL